MVTFKHALNERKPKLNASSSLNTDIDSTLFPLRSLATVACNNKPGPYKPDSITHGKPARYRFKKGFDIMNIKQGNTFAAKNDEEY